MADAEDIALVQMMKLRAQGGGGVFRIRQSDDGRYTIEAVSPAEASRVVQVAPAMPWWCMRCRHEHSSGVLINLYNNGRWFCSGHADKPEIPLGCCGEDE
jgi:hypothetical protein